MKNYQVYFFDIDGTLAHSRTKISAKISRLLAKLSISKKVVIISGASIRQILQKVINPLNNNANLYNVILLPTSGASFFIYQKGHWIELYNQEISEQKFDEINSYIIQSFNMNKIPIPKKSYGKKLEHRGSQITFSVFGQKAPLKIKSKWDPNDKKRSKIVESLNKFLPEFDSKIGGTSSIDITLKGIDKEFGIKKTIEYFNQKENLKIKEEDCVFVGDKLFPGGNDYPAVKAGVDTVSTSNPKETEKIIEEFLGEDNTFNLWQKIVFKIKKTCSFFLKIFYFLFKRFKKQNRYFYQEDQSREKVYVTRHNQNPILSPSAYSWENEGVFNPAAIYLGGRVHLLYRAMGSDGTSTIGYASSDDGINFDDRLSHPVYYPKANFELDPQNSDKNFRPDKYASGGGWSGCEDPKICRIGDRIFLTYVAFGGWDSIRIALTSISVYDFLNKNWNWTEPILCSQKGIISKSGGLFPEKIRGKYVFFQRIFPNIFIDYFDNLRFKDKNEKHGKYQISPQKKGWDSRKISFGSTPIKTKHGWLVITHGVDDSADHQYHMGAMLLDLEHPEKVLYRSAEPILSPELWYENDWKPGIVYPCGAVNKDGVLLIYYGGGDKYVCVASAPFDDFVESLISDQKPKINKIKKLKKIKK